MVNIINGRCQTNLDDYQMTVDKFYSVPNIGDRVTCLRKGSKSSLKVCGITHDIRDGEPFIVVELNK